MNACRPPFRPDLFAHGRLLYRFPGSDACRFSPRLAWQILSRLDRAEVLWDPFCGTGLIPAMASLFFPGKFGRVVASDVNPEAVRCSRENLRLMTCRDSALVRLRELRGRQGLNVKSLYRWGEVADYLEELLPWLSGSSCGFEVFHAAAEEIPNGVGEEVVFVADVPYDRKSVWSARCSLDKLWACWKDKYPRSRMCLVSTGDPEGFAKNLHVHRVKKGRVLVRANG